MPHPGESKQSPRRLTAKEKATQAMQLRKSGATYTAIAEALHFKSPQAAYDAVARGLKAMMQEPADELRKVEVARLDALLLATWPRAVGNLKLNIAPDTGAVNSILRIMERRAALLGLDAPTRQEVTGAGGGPLLTQIIVADQETEAGVKRLLSGERTDPTKAAGAGDDSIPISPLAEEKKS